LLASIEVVEPVEIWTVALDPPEEEVTRLYRLLWADERERAGRSPFAPRKRRYVARQGALRKILADYLGLPASEVELARSLAGKPVVAGAPAIRFSVSDSADLALVAVARCEVGVDVERVRQRPIVLRSALATEEFFERWTRHEAVGKARGTGLLSRGADRSSFAYAPVDVGPGFAAAVAVEADRVLARVRAY
jgi:4'-phosphopantetheinyl transferase